MLQEKPPKVRTFWDNNSQQIGCIKSSAIACAIFICLVCRVEQHCVHALSKHALVGHVQGWSRYDLLRKSWCALSATSSSHCPRCWSASTRSARTACASATSTPSPNDRRRAAGPSSRVQNADKTLCCRSKVWKRCRPTSSWPDWWRYCRQSRSSPSGTPRDGHCVDRRATLSRSARTTRERCSSITATSAASWSVVAVCSHLTAHTHPASLNPRKLCRII